MKIQLYNLWHNGDVFSGRGYIDELKKQIPEAKILYYHNNNRQIVADLVPFGLHVPMQKWEMDDLNYRKFYEKNGVLFINTWVGTYFYQNQSVMKDFPEAIMNLPGEGHANYLSLHKIYKFIFSVLNDKYDTNVHLSGNPFDYIPTIDWSKYRIDLADEFLKNCEMPMNLFCNGNVKSRQSGIGDFSLIINHLAERFPNEMFICTQKFENPYKNVFFTQDIFNIESDINEIAYLSTYCKIIVGKNSGPFMFTHIKDNINNSDVAFVAFSQNVSDCYPHHTANLPCKYFFSNKSDPQSAVNTILNAMRSLTGQIIEE